MNSGEWKNIERLFNAAVSITDEGERAKFIERETAGDDELARRLRDLLAQDAAAGLLLDETVASLGAAVLSVAAEDDDRQLLGETFGHYTFQRILGRGGMGTVFLATDERLKRLVALKMLTPFIAHGAENAARFLREARAASSVTHQTVVHIYDFGQINDRYFLAMEYVPGKTLREIINEASLGSRAQIYEIVRQVALGIEAAHEKQIIHRDIKPENILITDRQEVKVLDFGLAKRLSDNLPEDGATVEGQPELIQTRDGVIIGTAAYMSPEQIRGQKINGATDLWSLSVVLYEMLRGRRPFRGESVGDIQASVLRDNFQDIAAADRLPPAETEFFRHAFARRFEQRFQNVREYLEALKMLEQNTAVNFFAPATSGLPPAFDTDQKLTATTADDERQISGERATEKNGTAEKSLAADGADERNKFAVRRLIPYALAGILLLAGGGLFFETIRRGAVSLFGGDSANSGKIAALPAQRPLTNNGRAVRSALAPGGDQAAYVIEEAGNQGLYWRESLNAIGAASENSSGAENGRVLVEPGRIEFVGVAFAPDGKSLYYAYKNAEDTISSLYQLTLADGRERKVLTDIDSAPAVSPDGKQLVFLRINPNGKEERLIIADSATGEEKPLTIRQMPEFFPTVAQPSWSADSKTIACPAGVLRDGEKKSLLIEIAAASGEVRNILPPNWTQISQAVWEKDGKSLIITGRKTALQENRQLWRVGYPGGETTQLTSDFIDYAGVTISDDGRSLLTIAQSKQADLWIAPVNAETSANGDKSGAPQRLTENDNTTYGVDWVSENEIIYSSDAGGNPDIWRIDPATRARRQLTDSPYSDISPAADAAGDLFYFTSTRLGDLNHVWQMNAAGGDLKQLTFDAQQTHPMPAPDGRVFYYHIGAEGDTLKSVSTDGSVNQAIARNTGRYFDVSANGKFILTTYRSPDATAYQVAVLDASGTIETNLHPRMLDLKPKPRSDDVLRWSPSPSEAKSDGAPKSFLFIVNEKGVGNLWRKTLDGGEPQKITDFGESLIYAFDFSPDGKKIVCSRGATNSRVVIFNLRR